MRPEVTRQLSAAVPAWLTQCLVDGDEAQRRGARRIRRKALIISLLIQFALIAALFLAPLLAGVSAPRPVTYIPVPPFARSHSDGAHSNQPPHPGASQPPKKGTIFVDIFHPANPFHPGGKSDHSPEQSAGPPDVGSEKWPFPGVEGGTNLSTLGVRPTVVVPPTHVAPQATKPVRISEPVEQAMLIHRVEPSYPPLAKQIHLEGTVRLRAIVGRDGMVRDLEVLSGQPLLAKAACEAVLQWRYRPTLLDGEAVEVETYITVVFQLLH